MIERIEFELQAFRPGGIFNLNDPAVKQHVEELEAKLRELKAKEAAA